MSDNQPFDFDADDSEHVFPNTDDGFIEFLDTLQTQLAPEMNPRQIAFAMTMTATMRRIAASYPDDDHFGGEVESSADDQSEMFYVRVWKNTEHGRVIIFGFDLPFSETMEYLMNYEVPS